MPEEAPVIQMGASAVPTNCSARSLPISPRMPRRIIGEGDDVVVLAKGEVTTKSGAAYNNDYCFVFRMEDGRIAAVTEYMDTALVDSVLVLPG
jgi:ketosteroid isomerase-like protein